MKFFAYVTIYSLIYFVGCGDIETAEVSHEGGASAQDSSIANGQDGADGQDGAQGPQGDAGTPGQHVVLVDQNDTEIGYYLERVDFANNTFEIMTVEGYRTVLDLDDASFFPPTQMASGFGVSCIYESNDCSGACYGPDERARGYILNGQPGSLHYVEKDATSVALNYQSYNVNTSLGTCNTIGSTAAGSAVPTQTYTGVLSGTLTAPITLKIKN